MKILTKSLIVLALLSLAAAAHADTAGCNYFYASPNTYYAPPGNLTVGSTPPPDFTPGTVWLNGNSLEWVPSFIVYATYVNNCSESGWVGSGFGSDVSSMLMTNPYLQVIPMMDFYDSSALVPPGGSVTLPFAWYVWSPDAPVGYTWTANISAAGGCGTLTGQGTFCSEDWGSSQFTAIVTAPPNPVPEPGTVLLLGSGLLAIAVKLRSR
jgi:hypothetical protein